MTDAARRRAAWVWPAFVVALLLVPIVAGAVLVVAATGDPSFGVESDYHAKALAWDEQRAQEARNAQLGWAIAVSALPDPARTGLLRLAATLVDGQGAPLPGATLRVEGFHLARSAALHEAELREVAAGRFTGTVPSDRPGLWELRFDARRGADRFTQVARVEVPQRSAGP